VRTQNQAVHTVGTSRPKQKIEIVSHEHGGAGHIALRLSTWADGLGWCSQKTIELEAEQLDELQLAVAVARRRLASKRADENQQFAPAEVIHLPTFV
jgi:hypothetical protein